MKTLVLVDGAADAGAPDADAVYWDRTGAPDGAALLQQAVESYAGRLRAEYLEWCRALSQSVTKNGETLSARLRDGLLGGNSFWWTSLIASKSPVSNPELGDVLKLRSLEIMFTEAGYARLRYRGGNALRQRILRTWCESSGHAFEADGGSAAPPPARRSPLRDFFHAVEHAAYFLRRRYFAGRRPFERRPKPLAAADLAVVTYFPNIDAEAARAGRFRSNYWGPLHELIERAGLSVNWIWFFHDSNQMTYREAVELQDRFNSAPASAQRFLMLEDSLTLAGVARAFWSYLRLSAASVGAMPLRARFTLGGGTLNFFGVFEDQWYSSLCGAAAMSSCLYAQAFRQTSMRLPSGARLLYSWESQGWEHALLCAWTSFHNGPSLAAVHAPGCVAAMDFRTFRGGEPIGPPSGRLFPSRLVAFSAASAAELANRGWPADRITAAESLRYMKFAGKQRTEQRPLPAAQRKLLVVTAMRAETELQLRLLSDASRQGGLARYSEIVIRPHPFCAVDAMVSALSFSVPVTVDTRALDALFKECDVVFVCNSTSAVVEAAWVGLPVIIAPPVDGVNLTPLNGLAPATIVDTPARLAAELEEPRTVPLPADTFCFDPDLSRWHTLLTDDYRGVA